MNCLKIAVQKFRARTLLSFVAFFGHDCYAAGLYNLSAFWRSSPVLNLSIAPTSTQEGSSAVFTVTLSGTSYLPIQFNYATSNGTALAGTNYTSTSGTATIAAGATSTSISVPTLNDTLDQSTTTFTMTLSNPSIPTLTISTPSATGTITDAILYYNFMTGSLPTGVSVSRATTATYTNSSGTITSAATNTARFEYDPATLQLRGLLVEPASTNLSTYSAQINTATWTTYQYFGSGGSTVTSNAANAPDGTTTATTLNDNNGSQVCYICQAASIPNDNSIYTASVFLKQGTSASSTLDLWLVGGSQPDYSLTVTWSTLSLTQPFGTPIDYGIQNFGNGWYRLWVSGANDSSGNTQARICLKATDTVPSSKGTTYAWGGQLEVGSIPTSYIPTTTIAVSRNEDDIAVTNSGWYNSSAWSSTLYFMRPIFEPTTLSTALNLWELANSGSAGNYFGLSYQTNSGSFYTNANVSGSPFGTVTGSAGQTAHGTQEIASVYNGSTLSMMQNGVSAGTGSSFTAPTGINEIVLGNGGASEYLQKFTYRARAVSNTQLTAYTSELAISAVSPSTASHTGGSSVALFGAGFVSTATVSIGGTACNSVNLVSSEQLTCTVPAGSVGTANVSVTSNGSTQTLTNAFTYN